jgi:hypothetical protein
LINVARQSLSFDFISLEQTPFNGRSVRWGINEGLTFKARKAQNYSPRLAPTVQCKHLSIKNQMRLVSDSASILRCTDVIVPMLIAS